MPNHQPGTTDKPQPSEVETGVDDPAVSPKSKASLSFEKVKNDPEVQALIKTADHNLGVLGFTEHGFRHVGLVSNIARNILRELGYDQRLCTLAEIAAYMHDIGNCISRHGHASTGAVLSHTILSRLGMDPAEIAIVMGAVGSHGDDHGRLGEPVHPVSAALILADKSDVHRSRGREKDPDKFDDHDLVNHATTSSYLRVDATQSRITLELEIETEMASVMKYFELFMPRMQMSRRAANLLDCTFSITINDVAVL